MDNVPGSPDGLNPLPEAARLRVDSVDLVRGLVMVVMVLDHVRDFFGDMRSDPTALGAADPSLFFTRWVTHYCAPTFLFLAGVSIALTSSRRSKAEESRRLILRGLWLIVLEQTWVSVFVFFSSPQFILGLIFWVIGISMIVMAGLIHLPRWVSAALGLAMVGLHNLADGYQPPPGGWSLVWSFLHEVGMKELPGGVPILIGYPLIPWVGVMALGYAMGPVFRWPSSGRRRAFLALLGIAAVAGFVALRWLNGYGDPRPWSAGPDGLSTLISFVNCRKNPPSLLYLLMTLGPVLLALAAFDGGVGRWANPLRTLGRVPLFYYLLQWPVAHGLAVVVSAAQGWPVAWMFQGSGAEPPPGYGASLARVYLFWIITVALLYVPSAWYERRVIRRRGTQPRGETGPAGIDGTPGEPSL